MAEIYLQIAYNDNDFLRQEILDAVEQKMKEIAAYNGQKVPEVKEIESA